MRRLPAMAAHGMLLLLGMGAALSLPSTSRAVDVPVREIFLGERDFGLIGEVASFKSRYFRFDGRYLDIYRFESPSRFHDYHESDFHAIALAKSGRSFYGLWGERNALTLENRNVYTDADRMSGGREIDRGGFLMGAEGLAGFVPGDPQALVMCAGGWGSGPAASLEARFAWRDRARVLFHARTFASDIDLREEIGGYRFRFLFPFRTDGLHGQGSVTTGSFQFAASLGSEVTHGAGGYSPDWRNALYYRRFSYGCAMRYRVRLAPGNEILLSRIEPGSPLPGLSLSVDGSRGEGDLGMSNHGVRYLHLQDAQAMHTSVRIDVIPIASAFLSIGWERIRLHHAGDSFFDVWPFSIWDVFRAKRYRLGLLDEKLDSWFVGAGCITRRKRFDAEIRARLDHIVDTGSLRWFERMDILYPFVFTYVATDETPDLKYRFVVQAEPALSLHATDRITITLRGNGIYPFMRERKEAEKPTPSPPPAAAPREERSAHGGLTGTVTIVYSL